MKKILLSLAILSFSLFLAFPGIASAATYYISPAGNDSTGSGTLVSPWFTLNKAWAAIQAGDTVYLRGGTYSFDTQQRLSKKNGTAENPINIFAYQNEKPILTRSSSYDAIQGIYFIGNYFNWRGIAVTGYLQQNVDNTVAWGMRAENSSYNTFEEMEFYNNGDGLNISNLGSDLHSTGNLILNSDFYNNQDPLTADDPYGNADGLSFSWITHQEDINTVRGCRFWWNSDDGIDFFKNEGTVIIENSWSFWNGYIPGTFTKGGDGNGFKLGSTVVGYPSEIKRIMNNDVAFQNRANGYDLNSGRFRTQIFNGVSYQNGNRGFRMADDFYNEGLSHIVKNSIAYQNVDLNSEFSAASILSNNNFLLANNSINSDYSVSAADFLSLDTSGVNGPRQADGSLPNINFLKLASGSDLIDSGINVGLAYNGSAPDLGSFESNYVVADTSSSPATSETSSDLGSGSSSSGNSSSSSSTSGSGSSSGASSSGNSSSSGTASQTITTIISTSAATTTVTANTEVASSNITTASDVVASINSFIATEKKLVTKISYAFSSNLAGRFLLQVENRGELWYVNPTNKLKYFLGNADMALALIKNFGIGINNNNLAKIKMADYNLASGIDTDSDGLSDAVEEAIGSNKLLKDTDGDGYDDKTEVISGYSSISAAKLPIDKSFSKKQAGKIFIQVESHGEAWYINPLTNTRYYLGSPEDAYLVLHFLSIGISNKDLRKIAVAEIK